MTIMDKRTIAPPPAPDMLVRFDNVRKSYDGVHFVVENINLEVRRGEFFTMLGPSGSGKTTCLMMLGGFQQPTFGHILLDGRPVERLPPEKRNIGFVFQNYALFPHMSVADNVAFPLKCRKIGAAECEARVNKALGMVQLGNFGARMPAQLSGGQQQRVALARALVFEPSLVLMDEPLGALDKQLREHMQVEIKHLQMSLGITMVYVTHDQSEALTMSDRIAVFHEGHIQQLDHPVALYERPVNRFVAGFIGENNLISCMVAAVDNGEAALVMQDGSRITVPDDGLQSGQAVTLAIRPERLSLGGTEGLRFNATITEVFYLGDHVRLAVRALGTDDLMVRVPATQGTGLAVGQAVVLGFVASDARILMD